MIHEVSWNAPKSIWKRILSCDSIFSIFWNVPKSKNFIFGWNAIFFLSDSENGKNGAFQPKIKFFDFGAFQKIDKMLSHDKIFFHMLFGAFHVMKFSWNFHDTSCRSWISGMDATSSRKLSKRKRLFFQKTVFIIIHRWIHLSLPQKSDKKNVNKKREQF